MEQAAQIADRILDALPHRVRMLCPEIGQAIRQEMKDALKEKR